MENEEIENVNYLNCPHDNNISAVNKSIIDYYKKFGKKRDIEQFFSLSTAQTDLKDPTSLFWKRMKAKNDSSDSGEKKSESSTELCRISIQCSVPEASGSQSMSDTESPPIVNEENIQRSSNNSEEEINKSDDDISRKSVDVTFDTSMNRPHSPTSSVTSQRKLEWDSLADVGYANESDRKTSASSLSTLERLALQQQYSNNDSKQHSTIGGPTAHSTPLDQPESKVKGKKEIKKTTRIYKKDVEFMELIVPDNSEKKLQPINVNLTKHISFNVEQDGEIKIDNITKNISLSPDKSQASVIKTAQVKVDKEIQTTLPKSPNKTTNSAETPENILQKQKFPVLISLNTLKKRKRRKKVRRALRPTRKLLVADKENIPQEKIGEQVSEAESFEYMPGHIYNQNQVKEKRQSINVVDNKSSLESSAGHTTTESSKGSQNSFTKDLEKSIDLLRVALQHRYDNTSLKKKLIKEVVQRLIKSKYRDDDKSSGFLSGLNFDKVPYNHTTSSTSDNNIFQEKSLSAKPKKSILRADNKFSTNPIATTSQSTPNLYSITKTDKAFVTNLTKPINTSSTDSDVSKHTKKCFSDAKTSSEELYKQYLEARKKEEEYKKHLKSKENFLRQKLSSSDAILNVTKLNEIKTQNRLKDLFHST